MRCRSYWENIDRIAAPNYLPTEADVLHVRVKTTGISETRFNMGPLHIQYAFVKRLSLRMWSRVTD